MISLGRHKANAVSTIESPASVAQFANEIRRGKLPLEGGVYAVSGVLRFESMTALREYISALLDVYSTEYARTTEVIASLYRSMGENASHGVAIDSWERVGELFVDAKSMEKGQIDVALQLLNDLKPKLSKVEEIVNNSRRLEELPVPVSSTFLLYMRNGTPERVIVDHGETRAEKFAFTDEYELV